jgi:hypothetical protein
MVFIRINCCGFPLYKNVSLKLANGILAQGLKEARLINEVR